MIEVINCQLRGFEGSGADFLEPYKKYIDKDFVTVVGPHKVFGPEQNDLSLQLRKQKIDKVILAGMFWQFMCRISST